MDTTMNVTVFIVKGTTLKTCPCLAKSLSIKPSAQYIFTMDTGEIHLVGDSTDNGFIVKLSENNLDNVINHCSNKKDTLKTKIYYPNTFADISEKFDENLIKIIENYRAFFDILKAANLYHSITKKQIFELFNEINDVKDQYEIGAIVAFFMKMKIFKKYGSAWALTEKTKNYLNIATKTQKNDNEYKKASIIPPPIGNFSLEQVKNSKKAVKGKTYDQLMNENIAESLEEFAELDKKQAI